MRVCLNSLIIYWIIGRDREELTEVNRLWWKRPQWNEC